MLFYLQNGEAQNELSELNVLCFPAGNSADEYSKTQSLQTWLFNCNMPDTLLIIAKSGMYFLGSDKKAQFFAALDTKENLDPVVPPLTIMHRDKVSRTSQP